MGVYARNLRCVTTLAFLICRQSLAADPVVVDPSTLTGKIVCGYQGWFSCPGDGNPAAMGWNHWSQSATDIGPGLYNTDMWPDVSNFDTDELFPAPPVTLLDGSSGQLYSSHNLKSTERHFKWMRENGIDGIVLWRFLTEFGSMFFQQRNVVTQNIMSAANTYGRVWCIYYDIGTSTTSTLYNDITTDWQYLHDTLHVTSDPRYQHHKGKPVVGLWGFGLSGRPGTPAIAAQIVDYFHNNPTYGGVTLIAGVDTNWRTDSTWGAVIRTFDIISPWTVGSFVSSTGGVNGSRNNFTIPDLAECNSLGIDYLQVFFPGFSWDNLMHLAPGTSGASYQRNGGQFFWDQANAFQTAGVKMMQVAMFDEMDEGTAILKVSANHPATDHWVDYGMLPTDWYMRLAGAATRMLRGEIPANSTLPSVFPIDSRCAGDEASLNLGEDIADRMTHPQPSDGDTTIVTQGGVQCRRNLSSTQDLYFYFAVADSFAFQGSVPQACITVDYYDTGGSNGSLHLQYDSNTGSTIAAIYKEGGSVTLSTTNKWKRKIFYVGDAYFGNRQNSGADFRITLSKSGGGNFYIDRVLVTAGGSRPALLEVSPLNFSHTVVLGKSVGDDSFIIRNTGALPVNYTVTPNVSWLSLSPTSGTGSGETDPAIISYNLDGILAGNYSANIQIAGPGAANSPQTVQVNLGVHSYGDLDHDQDVDQSDFGLLQKCFGPTPIPPSCSEADFDENGQINAADFNQFRQCMGGPDLPPGC